MKQVDVILAFTLFNQQNKTSRKCILTSVICQTFYNCLIKFEPQKTVCSEAY